MKQKESSPKYAYIGHEPNVIDFLKKCTTINDVKDVIKFMVSNGDIDEKYGKQLLDQAIRHGIKSFFREKKKYISNDK